MKLLLILFLSLNIYASQRCRNYIQEVKLAHYEVFGVNYPYWYGVGQLQQESGCRNVISKDGVGSQGLSQITYRVWKKYLDGYKINNLNSTRNQLRAQAYIMKNTKQQAYTSHLWGAYQIYNGGGLVNKEISRARKFYKIREVSQAQAEKFCRRGFTTFSNGQKRNNCDINYEYSKKVFEYGNLYKTTNSDGFIFW